MPKTKKKTALVLSGGGSRGAYQIGVWQALSELGIRIDMVTGSSVGAVNGAAIAQNLLEPARSMWESLDTETVFHFSEILKNGGGSYNELKKLLTAKLSEDEIRRSEIELGLVTVEFPSMEPHYLWKEDIPQGELLDYILASASCFPAVQSYKIGEEKYIDGGYGDNLPVEMALSRGADRIIAVNLETPGIVKKEALEKADETVFIEPEWDLGNWLKFDKVNTRRIMRLGYLDAMKAFAVFDGRRYTFVRGAMEKSSLRGAEQAAAVFELDPTLIYCRSVFHERLTAAIAEYREHEKKEIAETKKYFARLMQGNGLVKTLLEKNSSVKNFLNELLVKLAALPSVNSKALTLFLAQHILETEPRRRLRFSRPVLALFAREIDAAYFLAREKI